jgi:PadR family transcriptional regulator, regulatory protein PadR
MDSNLTLNEVKVLSTLLAGEKYGLEIIKTVKEEAQSTIFLGSLYNLLSRLDKKGFVECRWGDETSERGGDRRKYYKITGLGATTVRAEQRSLTSLWGMGEPQHG